jgi:hypothetical protein
MSHYDFDDDYLGTRRSEPLSLRYRFADPKLIETFRAALPVLRPRCQTAIERIAALLYTVHRIDSTRDVSYGRSKSDYAGQQRYQGNDFTYPVVMSAVEALAQAGFIDEERTKPGTLGWRSTIKATLLLANMLNAASPSNIIPVVYEPIETIRLRAREGRLVDYRENDFTRRARRIVEELNEMNRSARIELGTDADLYRYERKDGGAQTIYLGRKEYHRVFTWDFSKGGRFYGPFWQGLPKSERDTLTIDGEPVEENDFPMLHAVLLYGLLGKAPPADSFDLPEWPRSIVKMAFYTMINADNRNHAQGCIQLKLFGLPLDGRGCRKAGELMGVIERKHAAVGQYFYSGMGRVLMRADADIAERVMRGAMGSGVVAISVHDSFIAQARHSPKVRELMDKALLWKLRQLNPDAPKPHPVPTLVLVLPEGRQLNLFGETITLPTADLKAWRNGIMPDTLIAGLRHLQKSDGLRQDQLAAAIGISRPHLSNALHGRSGLGVAAAQRVKAMLQKVAA